MVDDCYGEFMESIEPPALARHALFFSTRPPLASRNDLLNWPAERTNLIRCSLVKIPGGAIAPCGGYVAGKSW